MRIEIHKYLGKWFEIARIQNDFEQKMENVTAEYKLNEDGTIKVINSGYINGQIKQVVGTAKTTDEDDLLKVSFFNNIYSSYKILAIDKNYNYSLVGGSSKNFLWILSRTNQIPMDIFNIFIKIAKENDYNVDKIKI